MRIVLFVIYYCPQHFPSIETHLVEIIKKPINVFY